MYIHETDPLIHKNPKGDDILHNSSHLDCVDSHVVEFQSSVFDQGDGHTNNDFLAIVGRMVIDDSSYH